MNAVRRRGGFVVATALTLMSACSSEAADVSSVTSPERPVAAEVVDVGAVAMRRTVRDAKKLVVTDVVVAAAGYVVAYDGASGAPGAVLGVSRLLAAGEHDEAEIRLDRAIEDDQHVFVVVHVEDNGNASFDAPNADAAAGDVGGALALRVEVELEEAEG